MLGVTFSLEKRIDIWGWTYVPVLENLHVMGRTVSYDNAATFIDNWLPWGTKAFSSSVSAACSGDGTTYWLAARDKNNRLRFAIFREYFTPHELDWREVQGLNIASQPGICCDGTGLKVFTCAKNAEGTIYYNLSQDVSTQPGFTGPIPAGVYKSAPGCCCSADRKIIHVFAAGMDDAIYASRSTNGGSTWDITVKKIDSKKFKGSPGCCCSADGKRVYVFARGEDNKCYYAFSTDSGNNYTPHNSGQGTVHRWSPVLSGVLKSSPRAVCSWNGKIIQVFGIGNDDRIYRAGSVDFHNAWSGWAVTGNQKFIIP